MSADACVVLLEVSLLYFELEVVWNQRFFGSCEVPRSFIIPIQFEAFEIKFEAFTVLTTISNALSHVKVYTIM